MEASARKTKLRRMALEQKQFFAMLANSHKVCQIFILNKRKKNVFVFGQLSKSHFLTNWYRSIDLLQLSLSAKLVHYPARNVCVSTGRALYQATIVVAVCLMVCYEKKDFVLYFAGVAHGLISSIMLIRLAIRR